MTTATKWTKAAVLRLAKRYHSQASIIENRNAPSPTERDALKAETKSLNAEADALKAELLALKPREARKQLERAARFVVDVNGDAPSIDQLREAIEIVERIAAIDDRLYEIKERRDWTSSTAARPRYEAVKPYHIGGIGTGRMQLGYADTLEELATKLGG